MDVVALAQHGVEYAVATLGTATTPVHVQKLFRLTDTVVFCFDGDAAGRRAAWRALENTLPVLADGKNARFLFLPDGEDPDDFVRKRGKAAFEALVDARDAAVRIPAGRAGRSASADARPKAARRWSTRPSRCWAQITAPVLATLLRRGLAELAGLREAEMRIRSLPASARGRDRAAVRTRPQRDARRRRCCAALMQGVLLEPELDAARSTCPSPTTRAPKARRWRRWSRIAARSATRR